MAKQDRWILITGASTGIGRATAVHLAQRGYRVIAGVRRETDAADVARARQDVTPIILDVAHGDQIEAARKKVLALTGPAGLYALINNAGFNYNAPFEFTDEAKARAMMEVNFFGLYRLSQALLPSLRAHARLSGDTAKLINISSIGGLIGLPWESFYHASKFAVIGLSESLSHEVWPHGVRVTAVCPGGVKTPFLDKTAQFVRDADAALSEEGRALYGAGLRKMARAAAQAARLGSPPDRVATKIAWVLERKDPPRRVLVGPDARLLRLLQRTLPESWMSGIVRATL